MLDLIEDASVRSELRDALMDGFIDDSEVSALIRATLDHNSITHQELRDLARIVNESNALSYRSKQRIKVFVRLVRNVNSRLGHNRRRTVRTINQVEERVFRWMDHPAVGMWTTLDRWEIGLGLIAHLRDPGLINQSATGACTTASLLFAQASQNPHGYARFVMNLYDHGSGHLGNFEIRPNTILFDYNLPRDKPRNNTMWAIDWMTLASIRNTDTTAEEWRNREAFDSIGAHAGANSSILINWLDQVGYTQLRRGSAGDHLSLAERFESLREAGQRQAEGWWVFLSIDARVLSSPANSYGDDAPRDNHLVVLTSLIDGIESGINGSITFRVFTWGHGRHRVPREGKISMAVIVRNFFGYIAVRG